MSKGIESKGYHEHDIDILREQMAEGGFNFETQLAHGQKMNVHTDNGVFRIEANNNEFYISGDEPFSQEQELVKIYGIPMKKDPNGPERMQHNYILKNGFMEILLVNKSKQARVGPIKGYELL